MTFNRDLGRGYISLADGLRRIEAESLLFGVEQDLLIPIQEQQCVVRLKMLDMFTTNAF